MVWKFLNTVGRAIVEAAKLIVPRPISYVAEAFITIVDGDEVLSTQLLELQLARLKLQYLQHQENIEFQQELAKVKHEQAKELQAFIQQAKDLRLQKTLDFQRWCLEEQKALQLELWERERKLQQELIVYQRQTSLKVVEEQKRLENSPIWLVASDILSSHPPNKLIPLRIFFAPPKLLFDRFANVAEINRGFPDVELTLAEGLRQFFRQYSIAERTIDFLAGAWVSKSFHSEASIKAVYSVLKSEPTLVLESEVDGDYLNFRIAYWGWNGTEYRYEPIISRLPYRNILYESAKVRAQKWLSIREQLIAAGEEPEEVDKLYGGDNVNNLITSQKEEKFRQAGIDLENIKLNYIVNEKDFESLCQFLVIYHCLFAGLILDEYFLIQYNLPPLLPLLFSELTANVPDEEVVQEMILSIILYYQKLYQALESQRSSIMPELILDLALSLTHLQDKSWAKQEIFHSLQTWLNLRDLSQTDEMGSMLEIISSALRIEDIDYVSKLNKCLAIVDNDTRLSVKDSCYQRGLIYYEKEDYEAAILDLDRAIQLDRNWAEAYYHRGLAYTQLKQYQKAIEDYTEVLRIDSNWADAYNNRGNAYYKLGNYEQAIADYNQTLSINPNHALAEKNRDIVQGVLEELKRKQQEEKCKDWVQYLSVVKTLVGHSATVRCLAISPDGKILASGSFDDTIKLWELNTGKEIRTFSSHKGDIEALVISPDGQILVSGSDDCTIKLWELSTEKEILTLRVHFKSIRSLAISPNGQILASGDLDGSIKLWELSNGKELTNIKKHSGAVRCLKFSPDGQFLASASTDRKIKLWELKTFHETISCENTSEIHTIVFSPDGKTIFSGGADKAIKQWAINTGQQIQNFIVQSGWIHSLVISQDGKIIFSGIGDNTIKIWETNTGQEIRTLKQHSSGVLALAIGPDGKTLVSCSNDKTIKIWRAS